MNRPTTEDTYQILRDVLETDPDAINEISKYAHGEWAIILERRAERKEYEKVLHKQDQIFDLVNLIECAIIYLYENR